MNGFSCNVLSNVFSLVKFGVFLILFHGAGFFRYNYPSKEKRMIYLVRRNKVKINFQQNLMKQLNATVAP